MNMPDKEFRKMVIQNFPLWVLLRGSSNSGKYPLKGDTIQYIYTNSQHNNPLCRVVPIENTQATEPLLEYDKEKYKEMILTLQKQF